MPGVRQVGRAGARSGSRAGVSERRSDDQRLRGASGDQRVRARGHGRRGAPNGATATFTADIVVVSCGAINSAALLLRSANDRHPNGLANGSDVVGRHYMGHVNSVLMAVSKCPNPVIFQKTLSVNDFYFGSDDWKYPDGAHLLRRQAGRRHV